MLLGKKQIWDKVGYKERLFIFPPRDFITLKIYRMLVWMSCSVGYLNCDMLTTCCRHVLLFPLIIRHGSRCCAFASEFSWEAGALLNLLHLFLLLVCMVRAAFTGSYMSAHVWFNLINTLGRRDKMRGLPSILSLFRNEINKFNKTWARMLDSIYHMTLRLVSNLISAVKTLYFCHYVRNVIINAIITFPENL